MSRTGYASLPLHGGRAPSWLTGRMQKLAREISSIMIDEYGTSVFLARLSDPFWFQALGCVLGYDWHSSGVTTVVTAVLKTSLSVKRHGLAVCGGKGKTSRKTPGEIAQVAEEFGFDEDKIHSLVYASKMTAKVDNAAIQSGYQLYHHAFFVAETGKWAIVQQGMSALDRTARRYHWLSDTVRSFVEEPHSAIVCDTSRPTALNMIAAESQGSRKASVDLAKEPTKKLMHLAGNVILPRKRYQQSLQHWLSESQPSNDPQPAFLDMPRSINWTALSEAYEVQPNNYEELLSIPGVGPATVRGLALIAELVFGEKPSWRDPVKYSFAYGGKDGVPYPVDRDAMDESIQILKDAVRSAEVDDKEKVRALQGLRRFVPADAQSS